MNDHPTVNHISPDELARALKEPNPPLVLDVREAEEYAIVHLEALHIPMNQIPARLSELPRDQPIVTLCHHGQRSYHVALFLSENGFKEVLNLAGGIDQWALEIDPSLARY